MASHRQFDPEFKARVVLEVLTGAKTVPVGDDPRRLRQPWRIQLDSRQESRFSLR